MWGSIGCIIKEELIFFVEKNWLVGSSLVVVNVLFGIWFDDYF